MLLVLISFKKQIWENEAGCELGAGRCSCSRSACAHHWGHDCAPGTACPAAGVFPAAVCLQPSHRLALRYRHGASVVGKAQQHPSLRRCDQGQRCTFIPGVPTEPRSFHTARTLASLYSFPSWQCSQHPSPPHGPSWHAPRVAVWGSSFPHPFVLPSISPAPTTDIPGCPGAANFLHRTALPVTPLSLEQSLPLTAGLSIMRQPGCDRATVGRGTLQAGVLHPP